MNRLIRQKGFSIVEIVLVVVVVGIVGLLGYTFYGKYQASKTPVAETSQTTSATNVSTPPSVNSTADLDKAQSVIDQTDPDGSSSSDVNQLDSQLSNF